MLTGPPPLSGLDSGGWVGSEGDLFRAQVAEIPPHLDTAHRAFSQVARALDRFAEELATARRQMAGVRTEAEQTFQSLQAARADRAGLRQPGGEETAADPAARTAYEEHKRALEVRVDRLQAGWDEQLATAAGVNARVLEAAQQAGRTIRAAGRTSPTAGQSWLEAAWEKRKRQLSGWLDGLNDLVAEHAEAVRGLATVLRVVGIALVAIGAVLAVLGVGTAVMVAGFVLWGASDALDSTVDWAEGRITGTQLLFRAGAAIAFSVVGGAAGKVVGKALGRLAPKLEAVGNVRRLADSREALARARQAKARLPEADEFLDKTAAADGEPTLSGWKQPRPDGFTHATPDAVRDYAQRIGHTLRREGANDQAWRPDGWPGKGQASHAEKQQALTAPDHPIAVTKPMCADCREFFRRHAIHTGRPQIVTDPDGTRLFHPDGRIIPSPGPEDFGPTPPRPPDGFDREGVKVGAAAGADAGWNLSGQER